MPAPEPGERWGILGGAFDPVHNGHLALAQNIKQMRQLNGILLVPTVDPPHRTEPPVAPYRDRFTMTQLAAAKLRGLEVSGIEETTGRPSYTLETVRALRALYPEVELELVIGADQLAQMKTWYQWENLLREIKILVGLRPGAPAIDCSDYPPNRIEVVETPLVDLSSTTIRSLIRQGISRAELTAMMPAAVASYIQERKLYR